MKLPEAVISTVLGEVNKLLRDPNIAEVGKILIYYNGIDKHVDVTAEKKTRIKILENTSE
jgi:hypothetical protein